MPSQCRRKSSLRPSAIAAIGIPEVFELTMLPGRRAASTLRQQLALDVELLDDRFDDPVGVASRGRPASKLAVEMSLRVSGVKNGSGFRPRARLSPCSAASVVTSSSSAGTPALAKCAAI